MCKECECPEGLIIDELLCFVTNKFNHLDVDTLVRLCVETYTDNEIKCSKELLFDKLKGEDDLTEFKKRRSNKGSETKQVKNIRDIYQLLQEKGAAKWPQFVASDLSKLPPITYDHIDVTALLNQLQNVKTDVDILKEGLGIQCKIGDSLKDVNVELQDRVIQLEKRSEKCKNSVSDAAKAQKMDMPFKCTECDLCFENEEKLLGHTLASHKLSNNQTEDQTEAEATIESDKENSKMFSCSECEYKFMTEEGLEKHMDIHTEEKINYVVCGECDIILKSNEDLDLHIQLHQQKQNVSFACSECDLKFMTKENLIKHMGTHNDEKLKNVVCGECKESFNSNEELTFHMKTHAEKQNVSKKLFMCQFCDLKFDTERKISDHILSCHVMTEEHRIEDNIVKPSDFSGEDNLQMFACSECDYRFLTQEGLQKHVETHNKVKMQRVVCGECMKCFTSDKDLISHMQLHLQKKVLSFSCTECDYATSAQEFLKKHIQTHRSGMLPRNLVPQHAGKSLTGSKGRSDSISSGFKGRSDSVSGINPWDKLNLDDLARKYFVESLMDTDSFTAPCKNGKPIKPKDLQKRNIVSQEHRDRPQRKQGTFGTAKGSESTVNRRNYRATVFATRFSPDENLLVVKRDLERNLRIVSGEDHEVNVEKLSPKYDSYASFKVTCMCANTAVFMNPEIWPEGCLFRWWRNPRNNNANIGTGSIDSGF